MDAGAKAGSEGAGVKAGPEGSKRKFAVNHYSNPVRGVRHIGQVAILASCMPATQATQKAVCPQGMAFMVGGLSRQIEQVGSGPSPNSGPGLSGR